MHSSVLVNSTASAADLLMMGYGSFRQTTQGIHQRLFARAFIIGPPLLAEPVDDGTTMATERRRRLRTDTDGDQEHAWNNTTVCFVSADIGMGSDLLNLRVIQRLSDLIQQEKEFANTSPCQIENLSISGTHTHSAPGGYFQYTFYQVPSLGYRESVVQTYAEGIAQALLKAYRNLQMNRMRTTQSWLMGANRNRSPSSYLLNPMPEIMEYSEEGDTDKTMLQLSFHASNQTDDPRGFINWFAVHGTSMNASNRLISGDNKGYASYLAERYWNGTFCGRLCFYQFGRCLAQYSGSPLHRYRSTVR
jgi:neutral ceramidase